MLKRLAALGCCLLLLLSLAGCFRQSQKLPLPEGMDAAETIAKGIEVAECLGNGDYRSIYERLRSDVAATLTIEDVAALDPKLGSWQGVTGSAARGMEDEASGEYYALVTMTCRFEKGKRLISAGFDADGTLIGLRVAEVE